MQFSCAKCSTRYSVPDEKVRGKRVKTQCRKCGADILIEGPLAFTASRAALPAPKTAAPVVPFAARMTPQPAPVGPTARHEDPWTVAPDRSARLKMTTSQIVDAYASGAVDESAMVWKEGMATWQKPFDIPAIALALRARGLEPRAKSGPSAPPAKPTSPPAAPAQAPAAPLPSIGWDDEDEATRVLDPSKAEALLSGAAPSNRPPPRAPGSPPPPRRASTPPPKPPAPPSRMPVPPPRAPPMPAKVVTSPPPLKLDALVSSPFGFEEESTAVLAPDRARELLEAEAVKRGAAEATGAPEGETPLGFGFDDSTKVAEPDRARALLAGAEAVEIGGAPLAFPALLGTPADTRRSHPDDVLPSVMVSPSVRGGPPPTPPPDNAETPEKEANQPKPEVMRELMLLSNEPTRVVRVVRRPHRKGRLFWIVLGVALAAAAAGGLIASKLLQRGTPSSEPAAR